MGRDRTRSVQGGEVCRLNSAGGCHQHHPPQKGREEGEAEERRICAPFLEPQFEIQRRAADAPGLAVGLTGVGIQAQGGTEAGHRFADRAIQVAAHFVGVAEIFVGVK